MPIRQRRLDDSACRLGVSIKGYTIIGEYFCWLITDEDLDLMKMNSLVDILEGYTWEDIASSKRRWNLKRLTLGERSSKRHVQVRNNAAYGHGQAAVQW